mgnify:CR=1 FL=1
MGSEMCIRDRIRALEFYHQTGTKISEHNEKEREKEAAYRSAYFVLTDERKRLYERIDRRVEKMMEQGLTEEVEALRKRGLKRETYPCRGLDIKSCSAILKENIRLKKQSGSSSGIQGISQSVS